MNVFSLTKRVRVFFYCYFPPENSKANLILATFILVDTFCFSRYKFLLSFFCS